MYHDHYRRITVADLEARHDLIGQHVLGQYRPAVIRDATGYQIRVRTYATSRSGRVTATIGHILASHDGTVLAVPAGCAAYRPGRLDVEDLAAAVDRYAHPAGVR